MDYEKKYNEALSQARFYYGNCPTEPEKEKLEKLFPELRESEDEKMMNQLHSWMKEFGGAEEYTEKVYQWLKGLLEKQKESLHISEKCKENVNSFTDESEDERIRKEMIDFIQWAEDRGVTRHDYHQAKRPSEWIAYLEKQKDDRMKPIYDARESFESALEKAWNDYHNGYENVDKLEDDYVECAHAKGFREGYLFGIEKQKEHKWSPSEGEMGVLYKLCYISNQITDEDDTELTRLYQDLKREYFNGHSFENMFPSEKQKEQKPEEWNEDYREEDIQTRFAFYTYKDDPSVLYLSNVFVEETSRNHGFGTRILKAAEKAAEAIGAITICLKVKQDSPANAWYRKRGYGYVAFEDGYDWLEKNLEYLKPAKSAEWNDTDMKEARDNLISVCRDWERGKKTTLPPIVAVSARFFLEHLTEPKEWSEDIIQKSVEEVGLTQHQIDWFKTNVFPPKQEWSEEDEKMRQRIIRHIESEYQDWCKDKYGNSEIISDGKESCRERIAWLKSLRPSWKPSEEQMEALRRTVNKLAKTDVADSVRLSIMYDNLKRS